MGNLCDLLQIKEYLELAEENLKRDALIESIIIAHSAFVEDYCARTFAAGTYTSEKFNIYDNYISKIKTKHYPIISINNFKDNGSNIAASDYILDLENGIIELISKWFTKGTGKVEITYQAGYQTIPKALEFAVVQQVSKIYSMKDYDGMSAEKTGSYSYTKQKDFLLPEVKIIYDKFSKIY